MTALGRLVVSLTVVTCGDLTTTRAGRTKTCTAGFAPGRWYAFAHRRLD
jgi:hypothetical protein